MGYTFTKINSKRFTRNYSKKLRKLHGLMVKYFSAIPKATVSFGNKQFLKIKFSHVKTFLPKSELYFACFFFDVTSFAITA